MSSCYYHYPPFLFYNCSSLCSKCNYFLFILDGAEFKHIDQTLLKHCHVAATTCILELAKQNSDKSTICTCLEDIKFDPERIDIFYSSFQKNKSELENLLSSIGRCPPHICDASWRLDYQIKNSHVHKVNQPAYLITLNVENGGARPSEEVHFSCTMEQLQVPNIWGSFV